MKTTFLAKKGSVERKWVLVNAENRILGKLATDVAKILIGKNKPQFTPHVDVGDYVIVINAAKIRVTGNKMKQKTYTRYSGYPGGQRVETLERLFSRNPAMVVQKAVKGMLPHNKKGADIFRKLHVYAGAEHAHAAQNPQPEKQDKEQKKT